MPTLLILFFALIALMIGYPIKVFFAAEPASKWGKFLYAAGMDVVLFSQVLLITGMAPQFDLPLPVIVPLSPPFTFFVPFTALVGGLIGFIGKRFDMSGEKIVSASFLQEGGEAIVRLIAMGTATGSFIVGIMMFYLTHTLPIIEILISVVIASLVYIIYKRKWKLATNFSLFSGIIIILSAIFFPIFSPIFGFLGFIDVGGVILGVILLIMSPVLYKQYYKSKTSQARS
ncbi:MAG: hypothetical protein GWO20_11110 [Candidatus Korarchaeota archaeon]|nr:hypothetical protein [Candidatus Korarchaeota archaeon]NIU82728.1 hypothetical protein [Candidatus Thorarchaeota archaeon]NIW14150.1 hypothetical protein [Candidatus Thorarchaeota archaeon]NIW52253.1 hypothetical protein [Candidatus Korarchaeota archaeon]